MDLGLLSITQIPRRELAVFRVKPLPTGHFTRVVAHTYNPALQEAKAGGFQVEANLGYITTKSDCSRQSEC